MTLPYVGTELELFANAVQWKRYAFGLLRPYVKGSVLEVGAGIGANTSYLLTAAVTHWTCLEPDARLAARIAPESVPGSNIGVVRGTTRDLAGESFDTLLYLDVLEHVEDAHEELERAEALLNPGGGLIVLAPAYPGLYSPFDRAVGHWRRYTRRSLLDTAPADLVLEASFYLDCAGLLASVINRLLLRQSIPTTRQIRFWDEFLIPVSRVVDPVVRMAFGRAVVAVWSKPAPETD